MDFISHLTFCLYKSMVYPHNINYSKETNEGFHFNFNIRKGVNNDANSSTYWN